MYAFQITNTNIPGGYIKSWDKANPDVPDRYCLEATGLAAGANVRYIAASDCVDNDAQAAVDL